MEPQKCKSCKLAPVQHEAFEMCDDCLKELSGVPRNSLSVVAQDVLARKPEMPEVLRKMNQEVGTILSSMAASNTTTHGRN